MKIEFFNCPRPLDIASVKLPETPEFVNYKPDFELINSSISRFKQYPNVLIVAHGGSITSFYGFYHALKYQAKKNAYFLSTVDPDYIFELKKDLKPENTFVIAISKSGENITQIEMTAQFADYPMMIVTGKSSSLRAFGEKIKAQIVMHPPIGGRYTGLTEVGLLPAVICGLEAEKLFKGAKQFYQLYEKDNLAWKCASVFLPAGTVRLRRCVYAFLRAQFVSFKQPHRAALPRKFWEKRDGPNLLCPRSSGKPAPYQPEIFRGQEKHLRIFHFQRQLYA
jgi:hypothetical protein